ncbi:MAG TPA: T9SS type A sorting domain-containing protein [Bacteroidales bacterium]|nr:T9SS type A sorting domain-containing protein [Bacteroidales bacterium]
MKKTLFFLVFFLIHGFVIFAQNLTLSNGQGAVLQGDTVIIGGDVGNTLNCNINVTNNSSSDLSVKCYRTEIDTVPGSTNTVCWGGACWPDSVSQIPDPTIINAGSTTSEFFADYKANGHEGTSLIKYLFFNMDSIADSISFYCKFIAVASGVGESTNVPDVSAAFPNPSDKATFIKYKISGNDDRLRVIVSDMVGNEVKTISAEGKEGKMRIDTNDLPEGIYFYSFLLNNKIYYTKKLVVAHQ